MSHVSAHVENLRAPQTLIQRDKREELRICLEQGHQLVNAADQDGRCLVHHAVIKNRAECLKIILQCGGDPNAKASKEDNPSPLHLAAYHGSLSCVKILVENGADLFSLTDATNMTPKNMAAYQNMRQCKAYLEEQEERFLKQKKEEKNRKKADLKQACKDGNLEAVKAILEETADIMPSDLFQDGTNLLYLASYHGHYPIVKYLIEECDIRHPPKHFYTKETPLHASCYNGHIEIANLLLLHFPYLASEKSGIGETALHLAARFNYKYLAKLLVQGRAILKKSPTESIIDVIKSGDWIGKPTADSGRSIHLVSIGINARNDLGETPLFAAASAREENLDVIELFLHQPNVDVKIAANDGRTALHGASAAGHTATAEALIKAGSDVHAVTVLNGRALTPLVEASAKGHLETVRLLMSHGAKDAGGEALRAAREKGHMVAFRTILARTNVDKERGSSFQDTGIHCNWNQLRMEGFDAGCLEEVTAHFRVGLNECHVTVLQIDSNELKDIPVEVFHLPKLRHLDACSNQLSSLPAGEGDWQCEHLQYIEVSENQLKSLPIQLFQLKSLKVIQSSRNLIEELPPDMWLTKSLEKMYISHNRISKLPGIDAEIARATGGGTPEQSTSGLGRSISGGNRSVSKKRSDPIRRNQHYNVGSTNAHPLQSSGQRETTGRGLATLDVSANNLKSLPNNLPCLAPRLRHLNASKNSISSVSVPHGLPPGLTELRLDDNQIEEFACKAVDSDAMPCPRAAPGQQSVKEGAVLETSLLMNSPCEHRQHKVLDSLRTLSLARNRLKTEKFLLSSLHPGEKPSMMTEQMTLMAASVVEEGTPLVICPSLKRLNLRENRLKEVPESVYDLEKLVGLELEGNKRIVSLPLEMGKLKHLWDLNVEGLPLVDPPPDVVKKGAKTIVEFLWQKLKQAMPYRRLKLMIVGSHCKGKTTLMRQLTKDGQRSESESAMNDNLMVSTTKKAASTLGISTVGIDIVEWTLGRGLFRTDNKITFMIWDFGGQEEYHATHQVFLSRRSLYLVVWSLADGMEGIEGLGQWLTTIESRAPSSAVIIIGTFLDYVPERQRRDILQKYVTEIRDRYGEEGRIQAGFPIIYGIFFVNALRNDGLVTSLRRSIFGIASRLQELASQGGRVGKNGESRLLLEQHVPAGYIQIEERVTAVKLEMTQKNEVPVLRAAEFKNKILSDEVVAFVDKDNDDEVNAAVDFLHENGILLHFTDGNLADYYFLSPQWLCDMLAHIITVQDVNRWIDHDGILLKEKFKLIFTRRQFPLHMQKCYLELLDKFEVAVQLDESRLLIPSRLPDKCDDFHPAKKDLLINSEKLPLHRHYGLQYIPNGLWPRLISRLMSDKLMTDLLINAASEFGLPDQPEETLQWKAWKTGVELRWKNHPIVRVNEIRDAVFSHRRFADSKLVEIVQFLDVDSFQPYKCERNICIQVWVASSPSKILFAAPRRIRQHSQPPSHQPTDITSIYTGRKTLTISERPIDDDFIYVDKEKSVRSSASSSGLTSGGGDGSSADQTNPFRSLSGSYGVSNRPEPLAVKIFTRCLQNVNYLLEDWFHGLRRAFDRLSLCPECLRTGLSQLETGRVESNIRFCVFAVEHCLRRAADCDTIPCSEHGDIPLLNVVPDALFGDLPVDQIIDSKCLTRDKLIGKGGFAEVWEGRFTRKTGKAYDRSETLSVALKVFRGFNLKLEEVDPSRFPEGIRDARDEVSLLSTLKHNHVVSMLGICLCPVAVVLELAPLGSLNHVLDEYAKSRRLVDAVSSRDTALQVAQALSYLHDCKIIYLDLKSANVLVWKLPYPDDGKSEPVLIKVSDLGICKFAQPGGKLRALGGTPGFMAPELLKHHGRDAYDNKVDIFSYGVMLYEMITTSQPMEGMAPDEVDRAYVSGSRPALQVRHMDERVFLRELMYWCWNQQPFKRPAARDVIGALTADQFLRLVGGVRVVEGDIIRCACSLQRESIVSPPESQRSSAESYASIGSGKRAQWRHGFDGRDDEPANDGPINELWICCGDANLGKVVVVSKAGRQLRQEEFPVSSSCVLCVAAVNGLVWIGTEAGFVRVIAGDTRKELCEDILQSGGKNAPVMCLLHHSKSKRVFVGTGRGNILAYLDEISPAGRLQLTETYDVANRIVSCMVLVDGAGSGTELWCGLNFAEIHVLNCETLRPVDGDNGGSGVIQVKDGGGKERTKVSVILSHLTTTNMVEPGEGCETEASYIFCALTSDAVVKKISAVSRKLINRLDVAGVLTVKSTDIRVTALHCYGNQLYVGTSTGCILIADLYSLAVSAQLNGFCNSVATVMTIPAPWWCLFPPGSEPSRLSAETSSEFYLASFGDGLRGYGALEKNQEEACTGFLLLWRID